MKWNYEIRRQKQRKTGLKKLKNDAVYQIKNGQSVKYYGGNSIAVYDPKTKDKTKAYRMMNDNRIKFFAPADYSTNSNILG